MSHDMKMTRGGITFGPTKAAEDRPEWVRKMLREMPPWPGARGEQATEIARLHRRVKALEGRLAALLGEAQDVLEGDVLDLLAVDRAWKHGRAWSGKRLARASRGET